MSLILGIDPGSRRTGFGLVRDRGGQLSYVASGIVRLAAGSLPARLGIIHASLSEIIDVHAPDQVAIEEVFMARNAASALKLGQARGAAIAACVARGLPVSEYSARQIKQNVVGTGGAAKEQVQYMVRTLLALPSLPGEDAADALACALCHARAGAVLGQLGVAAQWLRTGRQRRGRLV